MVYVPRPAVSASLDITNLESFLVQLEKMKPIIGGIAVYGPAAAYALVPEYGWARGPGKKTLWGTNAKGQRAIMSTQAPEGYVSIHEKDMWPIIIEEISQINFSAKSEKELTIRLEVALDNAAQRIAQLIANSAPVDSGDLKSGVNLVDSTDDINSTGLSEGQVNLFF